MTRISSWDSRRHFAFVVLTGENFAYGCSGIGTALGGPSLAQAPVIVGGSEEQKKKYLGMYVSPFPVLFDSVVHYMLTLN